MHLEIVGRDAAETQQVGRIARGALKGLGIDCVVKEVTELRGISQHETHQGPAIYIDGFLVSNGRLIRQEDVLHLVRWRHPQVFSKAN